MELKALQPFLDRFSMSRVEEPGTPPNLAVFSPEGYKTREFVRLLARSRDDAVVELKLEFGRPLAVHPANWRWVAPVVSGLLQELGSSCGELTERLAAGNLVALLEAAPLEWEAAFGTIVLAEGPELRLSFHLEREPQPPARRKRWPFSWMGGS